MSLPPGFLDELRTRLSIADVVGRKVMWDARKSNQAKGDMWAPCPFHQEKTASFHVDDKKGFYYCFGCHAKGDAITFVRETENVDFIEAVRILAGEAGMQMPERDPQAQQKADRLGQLAEVMEQAVRFYRLELRKAAGAEARDYLKGRRLDEDALDRWEIGLAPPGWQGLWDHLTGKGVDGQLLLDAGLAKPSTTGKAPYDTFRHRIMFPIRDARGRAIAFGGRAMDPGESAKYLNSPETELFDKGRTLYNLGPAREAAGKGAPLIVAEGYMDVIALGEAGFAGAVAPLGTAITETQLAFLWRVAPVPIVMLDGDAAGQRAAHRLIDLALPHLLPGRSLQFVTLPAGLDPDDFLKERGKQALSALLEKATPLHEMLWTRERDAAPADTPEQRADLDSRLAAATGRINDRTVQGHYRDAIKQLRWAHFAPPRRDNWSRKGAAPGGATSSAKTSLLGAADSVIAFDLVREKLIVAGFLARYQELADALRRGLDGFEFVDDGHARIADVLAGEGAETDPWEQLRALGLADDAEAILANPYIRIHSILRPADRPIGEVRDLVAAELALLDADRRHRQGVQEAEEDILEWSGEDITWRIIQANDVLMSATAGSAGDDRSFETAESGALMDRQERRDLHDLLERIDYSKGRSLRRP